MISTVYIDAFMISLMVSTVLISVFILAVLRIHLSSTNNSFKKNYTALLINPKQMIEMKIPINDQKQQSVNQYSVPIQTETLYSCMDTNQEYYQSVLFVNDIPYFPVRETTFQKDLRFTSQKINDLKTDNSSNKNNISDI